VNYDLTVCDWRMPGLNGQQVFEQLRSSNPKATRRLIFMTGDVINEGISRFLREHHLRCLPKPFSLDEFLSAVNNALDAA
jgi:CheY-like chemotaxis protein